MDHSGAPSALAAGRGTSSLCSACVPIVHRSANEIHAAVDKTATIKILSKTGPSAFKGCMQLQAAIGPTPHRWRVDILLEGVSHERTR